MIGDTITGVDRMMRTLPGAHVCRSQWDIERGPPIVCQLPTRQSWFVK